MRRISIFLIATAILTICAPTALAGEGPVLTRDFSNVRDWTVRVEIRLRPVRMRREADLVANPFFIPKTGFFEFREADFALPLLSQSSMHETYLRRLEAETEIKGRVADTGTLEGIENLPEERRVTMSLGPTELQDVITYTIEWPMTCYETRIDEARAFRVPWPEEGWPDGVSEYLKPQLAIESDAPEIDALVKEWTKGNPKEATPYYLAKYLAGRVLEHYMPTEGTYREVGTALQGRLIGREDRSGFIVGGAALAAREERGPEHDLANLLVAVYRNAGIPARLVVGLDPRATDIEKLPVTRAWVEFLLYDEADDRVEWIPVDIAKQRDFSSRAPALDRTWKFFGRNELFDMTVPIAARWAPSDHELRPHSGFAFYGWRTDPGPQICRQELRIWAFETPMKPGYEELERRRERQRPGNR